LGKALDELEQDNLDDDVVEKIKKDLIEPIYSDRETTHDEFETSRRLHRDGANEIYATLSNELSTLKSISRDLPLRSNVASELRGRILAESFKRVADGAALSLVENRAKAFNGAVSNVIDEQLQLAGDATQKRITTRTNLIRNVTLCALLMGAMAVVGVWTLDADSFWGNLGNWIATATFGLAFPIAARYTTSILAPKPSSVDFPDGRRAVRAELLRARDEIPITVGENEILARFEDHVFADLKSRSSSLFGEAQTSISKACERLNTQVKKFGSTLTEFNEVMSDVMDRMSDWHEPSDEKTGWIKGMSGRIKELSIEPSFGVLRAKKSSVNEAANLIKSHDVNVGH
ncbi:MAG: hypothetical protein AAFQ15_05020, partial [Pseudomonadota bacterium]